MHAGLEPDFGRGRVEVAEARVALTEVRIENAEVRRQGASPCYALSVCHAARSLLWPCLPLGLCLAAACRPPPVNEAETRRPAPISTAAPQVDGGAAAPRVTREEAELEAVALAMSSDPADVKRLAARLRQAEFLALLDDLGAGRAATYHLGKVMEALSTNRHPVVAEVCLELAHDPVFMQTDQDPSIVRLDRPSLLLMVLSSPQRPFSDAAVAFFRESNEQGYFAYNAPLLAANGTREALLLFGDMILDGAEEEGGVEARVECIHRAIVPHRVSLEVARAAGRIFAKSRSPEIRRAAVESFFIESFNVRGYTWFGLHNVPEPPAWSTGSREALQEVLAIAAKASTLPSADGRLAAGVRKARAEIKRALTGKR
jgi:hypothetical protein